MHFGLSRFASAVSSSCAGRGRKGSFVSVRRTAHAHLIFVVSVDGMSGHDASMVLKQLLRNLPEVWECSSPKMANYIKTTLSLSFMRATHCRLCLS